MLKIQMIGNLGNDAVITNVNNKKVIGFSLAGNKTWMGADGVRYEKTTWVQCAMFREAGQSCEISKYLKKGTMVFVEGKPDVRTWTDKSSGEFKAGLNVVVKSVQLLSTSSKEEKNTHAEALEGENLIE